MELGKADAQLGDAMRSNKRNIRREAKRTMRKMENN